MVNKIGTSVASWETLYGIKRLKCKTTLFVWSQCATYMTSLFPSL